MLKERPQALEAAMEALTEYAKTMCPVVEDGKEITGYHFRDAAQVDLVVRWLCLTPPQEQIVCPDNATDADLLAHMAQRAQPSPVKDEVLSHPMPTDPSDVRALLWWLRRVPIRPVRHWVVRRESDPAPVSPWRYTSDDARQDRRGER